MRLPPYSWFFGSYVNVENYITDDRDLNVIINYYKNSLDWPIEGFCMSYSSLEDYQSLSFNSTTYTNENTFTDLENEGFTFINILQPGVNYDSSNEVD